MKIRNRVFNQLDSLSQGGIDCATYRGIFLKTGFLIACTVISACISIIILNFNAPIAFVLDFSFLIMAIVIQFTISRNPLKAKSLSIPYVVGEGFTVGLLCGLIQMALPEEGVSLVSTALFITIGIFFAGVIGLRLGRIRVTSSLVKFVFVVVVGVLIGSVILTILDLITTLTSGYSVYAMYISSPISILVSIIMVIVSGIFSVITLDNVSKIVKMESSKEYEWYGAFTVAFSIIWMFQEVLNLLIRLFAQNRR